MKKIEEKIFRFINEQKLIDKGDKILIAFSGGPDSLMALHFFKKFEKKYSITISALHFNHQLRGKESHQDSDFCLDYCLKNNIEFHTKKIDVKGLAKKNKLSIEEAARNLRYKHLHLAANKLKCNKIVTAHNLTDNTETILLNLFSGTGLSGIQGIPIQRGKIIRPLLSISKREIMEYLNSQKILYRTDSSNFSLDYKRNYLRSEVLPLLRDNINPNLDNALFKMVKNLEDSGSFATDAKDYFLKKFVKAGSNGISIDLKLAEVFNGRIPGELIKSIFTKYLNTEFQFDYFIKLNWLLNNQKGKKLNFANGLSVVKENGFILFRELCTVCSVNEQLIAGEEIEIEKYRLGIEKVVKKDLKLISTPKTEYICADDLDSKFVVRNWKEGDKFFPLGMKGSKKISDFLTDKKIPNSQRNKTLVLCNRNSIVWVVGLRISDKVKITSQTKKIYKLWIN